MVRPKVQSSVLREIPRVPIMRYIQAGIIKMQAGMAAAG
jgi:hypothetical protein